MSHIIVKDSNAPSRDFLPNTTLSGSKDRIVDLPFSSFGMSPTGRRPSTSPTFIKISAVGNYNNNKIYFAAGHTGSEKQQVKEYYSFPYLQGA